MIPKGGETVFGFAYENYCRNSQHLTSKILFDKTGRTPMDYAVAFKLAEHHIVIIFENICQLALPMYLNDNLHVDMRDHDVVFSQVQKHFGFSPLALQQSADCGKSSMYILRLLDEFIFSANIKCVRFFLEPGPSGWRLWDRLHRHLLNHTDSVDLALNAWKLPSGLLTTRYAGATTGNGFNNFVEPTATENKVMAERLTTFRTAYYDLLLSKGDDVSSPDVIQQAITEPSFLKRLTTMCDEQLIPYKGVECGVLFAEYLQHKSACLKDDRSQDYIDTLEVLIERTNRVEPVELGSILLTERLGLLKWYINKYNIDLQANITHADRVTWSPMCTLNMRSVDDHDLVPANMKMVELLCAYAASLTI